MRPTDVFSIVNMLALPMWILMILWPKWKGTKFLMQNKIVPIVFGLLYATYIFIAIRANGMMDFGSLSTVMNLFTEENAVLAGWIHYLAFDLFIGMWMLKQNEDLGIHQLLMAPCLFLTFMFGPIGFLLFSLIKSIKQKKS